MDIGLAKLDKLVAHHVGNKIRDEGIVLSNSEPIITPSISAIILKDYLGGIKSNSKDFSFYHESDVNLNEILVYVKEIFKNEGSFFRESEKIAKHLYSKTTHPNIAGGDLFVMLFSGITIDTKVTRAIGIFKVESKEKYLSIRNENGLLVLQDNEGIDPREIQKAALVIEDGFHVLAAERGNATTAYWINDFLKTKPIATAKSSAQYIGKIVKTTVQEILEPAKVSEYRDEFNALLASEEPTVEKLFKINSRFIGDTRSEEIIEATSSSTGLRLDSSSILNQKTIQNATKSAFRKIRLYPGIDLLISGKNALQSVQKEISKDGRYLTITIDMGDNQ
ncbi:nucleoid-associated protein [Undibacterium sp. 14-3-2]|uniref:nucleoid-associated protein n=1 Tax=Undibacterium sp. 14-3-2 TaxID=2800129 RepID=UPI0019068168|nr:nucleoid-associated protein [Undibacterium sp. 14-3-2]MBK1889318.1 nucleoid-associated protein [Undibacterium sp. 14-3-2]